MVEIFISEVQLLTLGILFVLGLGVGSFLNVVVFRLGTGEKIGNSRSRCFSCGHVLRWYELIPLASFFIQKGRCTECGSRISWQYPVVELSTGVLFFLVVWNLQFGAQNLGYRNFIELLFLLAVFSLLLAISVYDFRHKIIPNQLVYPFIILSLLFSIIHNSGFIIQNILAGIVAFAFFGGLWFVSKGRWMGFGDAKLALGIGFLLGPLQTILAVVLSFWIGTAVALPLLLMKRKTMKAQIPFGPFLAAGTITAWFIGYYVLQMYFSLF